MKTLAELEAAFLANYAERGVQRQTVKRAEDLFVWLKSSLGGEMLDELEEDRLTAKFEKWLARRNLATGSRETWRKLLSTVRTFRARDGQPRPTGRAPKEARKTALAVPGDDLAYRIARVFLAVRKERNSFKGGRDYLLMALSVCHGAKPEASLKLRPDDVDMIASRIRILQRHGRWWMPVSSDIRDFLEHWLEQPRVKEEKSLFPGVRKGLWGSHGTYPDRYGSRLKDICIAAGVGPFTFADILRHWKANHLTSNPSVEREAALIAVPRREPRQRATLGAARRTVLLDGKAKRLPSYVYGPVKFMIERWPRRILKSDMDAEWGRSWRTGFNRYFADEEFACCFLRNGQVDQLGNDVGYGVASY